MSDIVRHIIHYGLHLVFPIFIALVFFKHKWKKAYLIMLATMIIDSDHLFANPVFDPNRCSVGFHFLHTYFATGIYAFLAIDSRTRIIGIGLLFHILTDIIDCRMMLM